MDTIHRTSTRRTSGAFQAAWVTVLVLSLGLFGAGAGALQPHQSPTEALSGAFDPVIGGPSSTGLSALSSSLRHSVEGAEDGEDLFSATGLLFGEDGYLSPLVVSYFSPSYPSSPRQLRHSPRAPPFV